jgi:phage gpG-like protein
MLKFTGDFQALDRFAEQLSAAAGSTRLISGAMAEETISLIRDGFAASEDPYGKPWEPIKLRAGQPLRDSGGLQASWHPSDVSESGFRVSSGKAYAKFHQQGTGLYGPHKARIVPVKAKALNVPGLGPRASVAGSPKRRMVPDRGRLPRKWREAYVEAAQEVLTELFEGK